MAFFLLSKLQTSLLHTNYCGQELLLDLIDLMRKYYCKARGKFFKGVIKYFPDVKQNNKYVLPSKGREREGEREDGDLT